MCSVQKCPFWKPRKNITRIPKRRAAPCRGVDCILNPPPFPLFSPILARFYAAHLPFFIYLFSPVFSLVMQRFFFSFSFLSIHAFLCYFLTCLTRENMKLNEGRDSEKARDNKVFSTKLLRKITYLSYFLIKL